MRQLKTSISIAMMLAMTLIWVGCQKEASNQILETPGELTNQRISGVVFDDPIQVGKVPLIISAEYLKNGQYSTANDQILISGRGKRDIIPPTISIAAPTSGSSVSGKVSVIVNATDNIAVKSVSLYVDGSTTAVMTSTIAPFSNSWNSASVANGVHTLTVSAMDASGNQGKSSVVQVNVNNVAGGDITSPTVSITSPADGAKFDPNISVAINAGASDNVGVSSVSFSIDGTVIGTKSSAPYTVSWNTGTVSSGLHTITAKATDAAGNQASKSIAVTVNTTVLPGGSLPASVSLSMPPVGYQGSESNCIAFALLYARAAEQYNKTGATGYSTTTNIFSPEFLYNQTKASTSCSSGASMINSLNFLVNKGVCTWNMMTYSDQNGCTTLPTSQQTLDAANYKIKSYSMVVAQDPTAVKTMLFNKHPLAFTFTVDENFYNYLPGTIWNSYSSTYYGPHAITLVGYDDSKKAYKAINQWGTGWGESGYIWIDYTFFTTIAYDLYVLNL